MEGGPNNIFMKVFKLTTTKNRTKKRRADLEYIRKRRKKHREDLECKEDRRHAGEIWKILGRTKKRRGDLEYIRKPVAMMISFY